MKKLLKPNYLPWIVLAAGAVGLGLRIWLVNTPADEKGLLPSGHMANTLLWILTVLVLGLLVFATARLLEAPKYEFNFPPSLFSAVGCALGACGLLINSVYFFLSYSDTLSVIAAILGALGGLSLFFLGWCRWKGMRPLSLCHVLICLFLMFRLISQYRLWSWDPQLQDYMFQLLAGVSMMLAAYHRATFDAGIGKRRPHAFYHLASVFFCCLSLVGNDCVPFFLGCGAWMLTDLCSLIPMPREEA